MKTLLTLFVLLFSSSVLADGISDFEIEGISIGDSLLDYISEEKIKKELKKNQYMYKYLNDDFGQVYLFDELKKFDRLSFLLRNNDKKYIIFDIRGSIYYEKKFEQCTSKQFEIKNQFSNDFNGAKISEYDFKYSIDPTGRSTGFEVRFTFESGDAISIICSDFEESLRIKNNWTEGLNISITTKEVLDWFNDNGIINVSAYNSYVLEVTPTVFETEVENNITIELCPISKYQIECKSVDLVGISCPTNSFNSFHECPDLLLGDINQDGLVNIQDIILIITIILEGNFLSVADLNGDDSVNVQDIISLVNIILND